MRIRSSVSYTVLCYTASLIAALYCLGVPAPSSAREFQFVQTSSTIPGFSVTATILIDGSGFADLPTLNNFGPPPPDGQFDFGHLNWLDLQSTGLLPFERPEYFLTDFTPQCQFIPGCPEIGGLNDFPQWSISPDEIFFINAIDSVDFIIRFFPTFSTIQVDTDAPTICSNTGGCIATGYWPGSGEQVPEPESALLFLTGISLSALALRRRGTG